MASNGGQVLFWTGALEVLAMMRGIMMTTGNAISFRQVMRVVCATVLLANAASAGMFSATVQFSGYNQAETLTNFPALVVLGTNITGFSYGQFQSGSNDLFFTDLTGATNYNYEIESWNTSGLSYVWVQVPVLGNNTTIVAWWGLSGQSVQACTTNGSVWSSGFVGVWHMGQTNTVDSTATHTPGLSYANTNVSGVIAGGQGFNGTSSYINESTSGFANFTGGLTLSVWANPSGTPNWARFFDLGNGTANNNILFARNSTTANLSFQVYSAGVGGTTVTATGVLAPNVWQQLVATESSAGSVVLYKNGAQVATGAATVPVNVVRTQNYVGRSAWSGDSYYSGLMDEVRMENVVRSSNWLWAVYQNMASNSAFQAYGAVAVGTLPVIANSGSGNLAAHAADVNGGLISTGASPTSVSLFWGTVDGTTNPATWLASGSVSNLGLQVQGALFANHLAGLTTATTYYYNYMASNAAGIAWGNTAGSPSFATVVPMLWYTNTVTPADSKTFRERWQSDGVMNNTLTINLLNYVFSGNSGDDLVAQGKIAATNLPAGLTASAIKASGTQLTFSLNGSATANASINSITNLGLIFADSAFTLGAAVDVTNSSESDLSIVYNDSSWAASGWNGSVNTFWTNAGNWSGGVPNSTTGALFNSTFVNQPNLTANATTMGLWLKTGVGQDVTVSASSPMTLAFAATTNTMDLVMDDAAHHNLTFGPNVTLSPENSGIFAINSGTLTVQGVLQHNNGNGLNLNSTNPAAQVVVAGTIKNSGGGSFNLSTTMLLQNASTNFTGNVNIYSGGTLRENQVDATMRGFVGVNLGSLFQLRSDTNNSVFCSAGNVISYGGTVDVGPLNSSVSNNTLWLPTLGLWGSTTITGSNGYTLAVGNMPLGTYWNNSFLLQPTSANLLINNAPQNSPMINGWFGLYLDGTTTGNAITGSIVNATSGYWGMWLTKQNSSTWTLSGSNNYTISTAVNGGTLIASNNSALGFGGNARAGDVGATTVGGGATLCLANATVNNHITLNTGSLLALTNTSATLASGVASVTFTNGGSGFVGADQGKPLTLSGGGGSGAGAVIAALCANTNTFTASGGAGWATGNTLTLVGGGASLGAVYYVLASGGGAITGLTLNAGYPYGLGYGYSSIPTNYVAAKGAGASGPGSGATVGYAENFSVMAVAMTNAGSGYSSAPAVSVTGVSGSGFLAYANLSSLTLNGTVNQLGGDGNLTLAVAMTNTSSGTFTKTGAGVLALANANIYPGPTVVTNGTLSAINVAGSAIGSGTLTISSNATLGGSGYLAPTGASGTLIALQAGAHLSPHAGTGANTATLHATVSSSSSASAMSIAGGTIFDFNIAPGGACDELIVTGNLTMGAGTNTLNVNLLPGAQSGVYTLINVPSGTLTYNVNRWIIPASSRWTYSVTNTATTVILTAMDRGTSVFFK